jgi:Rrf2 family transcriptional regulator, iron-sulfur cluster assembly transcription factor
MISESGIYAIQACEFLAIRTDKSHWPTKAISRELGISNEYLIKILQKLSQAGITESRKGKNGGVKLAADPGEITLCDILQITNPSFVEHCLDELPLSERMREIELFSRLESIQKETYQFLHDTTLLEFIRSRNKEA